MMVENVKSLLGIKNVLMLYVYCLYKTINALCA